MKTLAIKIQIFSIYTLILTLNFTGVQSYSTTKTDLTTFESTIPRIVTTKGANLFMFGSSLQKDTNIFDTKIEHVSDFDCFEVSETCVIVGNIQAKIVTFDGGNFKIDENTYSFNGDQKPEEFIWMKTAAVRQSTYFLVGVSTKIGLHRWKIGETDQFGHVELAASFGDQDMFIRDIVLIPKTPFALLSVIGYKGIVQIDFTQMTIKNTHGDLPSGLIAPLEKDVSLTKAVLATGNQIRVINYSTGVEVQSVMHYYFISAIANIIQSDLILVAEDTIIKIYDASTSMNSVLYQYEFDNGISSITYNHLSSEILVSGYKFASKLSITSPSLSECHPNCSGGCTVAFSPSACTSCLAPAVLSDTVCLKDQSPPDAITSFDDVTWSSPNKGPEEPKKGLVDEVMSKYKNYVYIGVGVLAFCCLCCICKSFCSSGEEEQPEEKESNRRKYKRRLHDMSISSNKVHPVEMY